MSCFSVVAFDLVVVILEKRKAERFDLGLKRGVVTLEGLGKRANIGAAENARKGEQANQPLRLRHGREREDTRET